MLVSVAGVHDVADVPPSVPGMRVDLWSVEVHHPLRHVQDAMYIRRARLGFQLIREDANRYVVTVHRKFRRVLVLRPRLRF
jgi:hypothetical protein